jgi:NADH dehydrogenase [ubiquinone] 1 alpha subcomplex assembly factor 6
MARSLRRHDRDRYLTALFAPELRRPALLALYAFNYEVARTREVVTEATLGEIRLQWWRDSLAAIYAGGPVRRHEVMEPLAAAIRAHGLSRAHFERLLDARAQDLADAPPPSLAALEAYAEASSASLVLLALEALGARDEAAIEAGRAVGIAYALAGLLRAVPFHARAKRLYLPADLAAEASLRPERELFELRSSPALRKVAEQIAGAARRRLAEARRGRERVPRAALPALLPFSPVPISPGSAAPATIPSRRRSPVLIPGAAGGSPPRQCGGVTRKRT